MDDGMDGVVVQSAPFVGAQSMTLRKMRQERRRAAMLRDKEKLEKLEAKSVTDKGVQTAEFENEEEKKLIFIINALQAENSRLQDEMENSANAVDDALEEVQRCHDRAIAEKDQRIQSLEMEVAKSISVHADCPRDAPAWSSSMPRHQEDEMPPWAPALLRAWEDNFAKLRVT